MSYPFDDPRPPLQIWSFHFARLISQFGAVIRVHQADPFDKFLNVKILEQVVVKCILLVTMMEMVMVDIKSYEAASEANKERDDPKIRRRRKSKPRNTMTKSISINEFKYLLLLKTSGDEASGVPLCNYEWVPPARTIFELFDKKVIAMSSYFQGLQHQTHFITRGTIVFVVCEPGTQHIALLDI
ncbi:hypothetical protein C5167_036914 [Papaver somniferum]|uniref:Uncharacterized protein n=1 Tax=Papaver somniferum TaxID=3469 RepID=A0A4Y7I8J9_PAPSO|nr:hypothetical protein C5167_036914 [Papaver somniferum]